MRKTNLFDSITLFIRFTADTFERGLQTSKDAFFEIFLCSCMDFV